MHELKLNTKVRGAQSGYDRNERVRVMCGSEDRGWDIIDVGDMGGLECYSRVGQLAIGSSKSQSIVDRTIDFRIHETIPSISVSLLSSIHAQSHWTL